MLETGSNMSLSITIPTYFLVVPHHQAPPTTWYLSQEKSASCTGSLQPGKSRGPWPSDRSPSPESAPLSLERKRRPSLFADFLSAVQPADQRRHGFALARRPPAPRHGVLSERSAKLFRNLQVKFNKLREKENITSYKPMMTENRKMEKVRFTKADEDPLESLV